MKQFLLIIALLGALPSLWGQAGEIFSPENAVDPTEPPAALEELREAIRERGAIRAKFVEQRRIPFKREAIELHGELAYSPELGLSLHYLTPEEHRIVLTENSIIRENEDGATQEQQIPKRFAALQAVLTLDADALAEEFSVYFEDGEEWCFGLWAEGETRSGPRRSIGRPSESIIVTGSESVVEQIELERAGSMRVTIQLSEVQPLSNDDPAASNRFFGK